MKFEETGFKLGDIVTYSSDKESTGGVIYVISENKDPYTGPTGEAKRNKYRYRAPAPHYPNGKKIPPMLVEGYVRIRPIFQFYPTYRGKNPKGKGDTVLLYYRDIAPPRGQHTKIGIVELGTRYIELGNLMKELARKGGMDSDSTAHSGQPDAPAGQE